MKRHSPERVLGTGKRNLVGYSFRTESGVVSKGDHLSRRDDTESCFGMRNRKPDVGVNEPLALTGHFSGHLNLGPRQRPHRPL